MNLPDIRSAVCDEFNVSTADFASTRRERDVARARQVAMWIVRDRLEWSYPRIAQAFEGRDHTTVMHAVSRVAHLMENDPLFADQVRRITQKIEGIAA